MRTIDVTIAGARLIVPAYLGEAETRKLAAEVSRRIRDIETESETIDTHAFALKAALSFAADLVQSEEDQKEDSKDILLALDALSDGLRNVLDQFGNEDKAD